MTDERKGQPSASGIERIALCPGSWNLESKLPPMPQSEDAATGDRIHAALAGEISPDTLSSDERETYDTCEKLDAELVSRIFAGQPVETFKERRYWTALKTFSGKADRVSVGETLVLIRDFKSGRNEVEAAPSNMQLRALAALASREHEREQAIVAIIQPWHSPQVSVCEYDLSDLRKASNEVFTVLDDANQHDAPLIPGDKQCLYCRAHSICPAVHQKIEVAKREFNQLPAVITAEHLETVKFVAKRCKDIEKAAKAQLEAAPDSIPGWTLKPGNEPRECIDPVTFFNRLKASGAVTQETFLRCIKVVWGDVNDQVKATTGMRKKDAEKLVASCAEGTIETKQNSPSIVRVKEAA